MKLSLKGKQPISLIKSRKPKNSGIISSTTLFNDIEILIRQVDEYIVAISSLRKSSFRLNDVNYIILRFC